MVATGNKMDAPSSIKYLSAVSRDNVRIDFLFALLNDLDIWAYEIRSTYLNAKCT